jgi:hypothetical protein
MWLEMLFSVYIVFRCREWVEKYIRFILFTCDWLLIANINLSVYASTKMKACKGWGVVAIS